MKTKVFITYAVIYFTLSIIVGNIDFIELTSRKGDDFILLAEVMTAFTYLFYLLFYFFINRRALFALLILPPVISIATFVFGFILVLPLSEVWEYPGTESGSLLMYSIVYSQIAIWLAFLIVRAYPEIKRGS